MQTKYHWQLKTHTSTFAVILYMGNRFTQMQEQYKKLLIQRQEIKIFSAFIMCLVQDNVYVYRFVNKGVDKHSSGRTYLRMPTDNKVVNAMVLASRWYVHKKHIREHCILHSDVPNSFVCTAHMTSLSTLTSRTAFLLNVS